MSGLTWHVLCTKPRCENQVEKALAADRTEVYRIRQLLDQPRAMDLQGEILERGDRVVITAEPLQDIEAVFDRRLSATGRVHVLVQFLKR